MFILVYGEKYIILTVKMLTVMYICVEGLKSGFCVLWFYLSSFYNFKHKYSFLIIVKKVRKNKIDKRKKVTLSPLQIWSLNFPALKTLTDSFTA